LALFLTACGDLGMVLPSQGSYRVNAQVDGEYTLDSYSVVTKNSKIRPYFVNSVVNDPDVRGLTVFVQDYSGTLVSRKVHYQLVVEAPKPVPQPEPAETPQEAPQKTPPETSDPAAEAVPEVSTDKAPPDESSQDEISQDEPPEEGAAMPGETETAAPEDETGPRADTPAFPGEAPPELPDAGFDDPAEEIPAEASMDFPLEDPMDFLVEDPTDFPDETPADSFDGGAWAAIDPAEVETESDDEASAADTAWDAADRETTERGATDTDTADTAAANTDTADIDAADEDDSSAASGIDTADADGTDAVNTNTTGKAASGADSAGIDTTGADTADTAAVGASIPKAPPVAAFPSATLPVETPKPTDKPPIPEDETVAVKQLDQYLPAFRIVEELDIGRYNLVFQVMGEKEILYRTFKPIYFLGDATFALGEIQSFLPVAVTGGRLIPPGINVMLEIETRADPRLDPYVIWYNSKKIIAQGRLSEGANSFLWKTPEQTGFHSIRVEVFPLLPGERMPGNMIGKIKELSLPVSAKSEGIRRFNDPSGEFIRWHQFWGTLDDAKAPNNPEQRLVSLYSQSPRWIPFGGMYSLLVGQDDGYALPGTPFKLSRDEQGTGRILFHLAALSEGSIMNIRFAGGATSPRAAQAGETADSPTGTAELDLCLAGNALILWIASEGESREESLELNGDEANGFVTVTVEFTIAPDQLGAELRLENPAGTTGPLSIALAAPLSGEGTIRLGGADSGHRLSTKRTAQSRAGGKYGNGTAALNELALSYARLPIPKKEKDSESGVPETLIAEEEEPGAEPELSSPNAL
jgi:hypothetical protein